MATTTENKLTGADKEWGYRFGVNGLMSVDEACAFLGGIHGETLKRKSNDGLVRRGRHPNGRTLAYCRRSVIEYIAQMEV
ncbi:hypothetical protein CA54_17060 [Symmachiella macrocystis]|uniref:Uncharacterized protein n=1 Tax=Symmachiella macrocystis TaxID=2527985 RepID=A0A5C6BLA0_9PLAN|nr:hypothetical protein [Symmachiella macrocystis]TWU12880.1 hypothetical protein CA54_17060 [Symmachiella macrocystis]